MASMKRLGHRGHFGHYVMGALNGPGCLSVTTAHDVNHHDYTTGFRCCADHP